MISYAPHDLELIFPSCNRTSLVEKTRGLNGYLFSSILTEADYIFYWLVSLIEQTD